MQHEAVHRRESQGYVNYVPLNRPDSADDRFAPYLCYPFREFVRRVRELGVNLFLLPPQVPLIQHSALLLLPSSEVGFTGRAGATPAGVAGA